MTGLLALLCLLTLVGGLVAGAAQVRADQRFFRSRDRPRELFSQRDPKGPVGDLPHEWSVDEARYRAQPRPLPPRVPTRQASRRRVQEVKARLGALRTDLVWVIEHPSLFDGATPASSAMFEAIARWDDEFEHLSDREADLYAGQIEDVFTSARRAAERLGLGFYAEADRGEAEIALKLVGKARATTGPEAAALMDKVAEILTRLLPFDPQAALPRGSAPGAPPA